jgi:hypothetical protein
MEKGGRMALFRMTLLLFIVVCNGNGQTEQPQRPDYVLYGAFFEEVWKRTFVVHMITISQAKPGGTEKPREILQPTMQESIGLTHDEGRGLATIATDCHSREWLISEAARPLVWEARLEEIDAGKVSSTVQQKLKLLEDQRSEMIIGYVRQLREMLGSDRFQIVET